MEKSTFRPPNKLSPVCDSSLLGVLTDLHLSVSNRTILVQIQVARVLILHSKCVLEVHLIHSRPSRMLTGVFPMHYVKTCLMLCLNIKTACLLFLKKITKSARLEGGGSLYVSKRTRAVHLAQSIAKALQQPTLLLLCQPMSRKRRELVLAQGKKGAFSNLKRSCVAYVAIVQNRPGQRSREV